MSPGGALRVELTHVAAAVSLLDWVELVIMIDGYVRVYDEGDRI